MSICQMKENEKSEKSEKMFTQSQSDWFGSKEFAKNVGFRLIQVSYLFQNPSNAW